MNAFSRWLLRAARWIAIIASSLVLLAVLALGTAPLWQERWTPADLAVDLTPRYPLLKAQDVRPGSAFDFVQRANAKSAALPKNVAMSRELIRLNLEPWSDAAFPETAKALAADAELLDLARAAVRAGPAQVPSYTAPTEKIDYLLSALRINNLFRASAARRVSAGDYAGAFDDLLTSAAYVQLLSRGGVLINLLVEIADEAAGLRDLRLIALQHDLPPEVLAAAIATLRTQSAGLEPLGNALREEHRALPASIADFSDPTGSSLFGGEESEAERIFRATLSRLGGLVGSNPSEVEGDLTIVFKHVVAVADQPYRVERMQRLATLVPRMDGARWWRYRDPTGLFLADMMAPLYPRFFSRFRIRNAMFEATIAVLAVREFEERHHAIPQALAELVPEELPGVPVDPFDGGPLHYRIDPAGKWIIYSVGPDQVDDGGSVGSKVPRTFDDKGDLVFSAGDADEARQKLTR